MTLTAVLFFLAGLAVAFLVGVCFACYRLRGLLKTKDGKDPPVLKAVVRALGGGGGGPIEPF